MTRVVILGGGPAGVGGAWKLRAEGKAEVTLFERNPWLGGNSGSFLEEGHHLDFGSHRLHPACEPAILADIRGFLGEDLLDRPRHGRIRLLGKWVHFPLKPADLLFNLDRSFALGAAGDMLKKALPKGRLDEENFATVLGQSLGHTICEQFYFPYAKKLWGYEPEALSAIQAKKRVSASNFGKLLRKVANQLPGLKPPGAGRFFYPREGFGQISRAYGEEARRLGAELCLEHTVESVEAPRSPGAPWVVRARSGDVERVVEAEHVWSTLPITLLARLMRPEPPAAVVTAGRRIDYRAMLLIYLELGVDQFTEYDAHYFPGADVTITRLSEPKNYAARQVPAGRTVLCAELPCRAGDSHWEASDEDLGTLVQRDLTSSGLPLSAPPIAVHTKRLPQAYPIYLTGYEEPFAVLDRWADASGVLTYGRQGLFAHDNTHHALAMAYAAVDCLNGDGFDAGRWEGYREQFAEHVVED